MLFCAYIYSYSVSHCDDWVRTSLKRQALLDYYGYLRQKRNLHKHCKYYVMARQSMFAFSVFSKV